MTDRRRWTATIYYRGDDNVVDVTHDLSELYELHDLVELGPHWDTIIRIVINRVEHIDDENLTLEQAENLVVPVPDERSDEGLTVHD